MLAIRSSVGASVFTWVFLVARDFGVKKVDILNASRYNNSKQCSILFATLTRTRFANYTPLKQSVRRHSA